MKRAIFLGSIHQRAGVGITDHSIRPHARRVTRTVLLLSIATCLAARLQAAIERSLAGPTQARKIFLAGIFWAGFFGARTVGERGSLLSLQRRESQRGSAGEDGGKMETFISWDFGAIEVGKIIIIIILCIRSSTPYSMETPSSDY